jgi:hypothetical protein
MSIADGITGHDKLVTFLGATVLLLPKYFTTSLGDGIAQPVTVKSLPVSVHAVTFGTPT